MKRVHLTRLWVPLLAAIVGSGAWLAAASEPVEHREVVLLFTNDFESAYDPIPAFWRDDIPALAEHFLARASLSPTRDRIATPFHCPWPWWTES